MRLSPAASEILAKLRAASFEYTEEFNGAEYGVVYLDNAIPQDKAARRSLPGLLSALSKAGLYREIDGFAWGAVKIAD